MIFDYIRWGGGSSPHALHSYRPPSAANSGCIRSAVLVRLHDRRNRSLFSGALSLRPSTPSIDGWMDGRTEETRSLFPERRPFLPCPLISSPERSNQYVPMEDRTKGLSFSFLLLLLRRSLGSSVPRHPSAVRPSTELERAPREGGRRLHTPLVCQVLLRLPPSADE